MLNRWRRSERYWRRIAFAMAHAEEQGSEEPQGNLLDHVSTFVLNMFERHIVFFVGNFMWFGNFTRLSAAGRAPPACSRKLSRTCFSSRQPCHTKMHACVLGRRAVLQEQRVLGSTLLLISRTPSCEAAFGSGFHAVGWRPPR